MPLPLPPGELSFKSPREYSGLLPRLKKKRVRNRFPRPPDTGTEPNSYEAVYAAAQPYPGKDLGQRCVCTQRKAASWMRPVRHWCAVPVDEDGPGSLRREQW